MQQLQGKNGIYYMRIRVEVSSFIVLGVVRFFVIIRTLMTNRLLLRLIPLLLKKLLLLARIMLLRLNCNCCSLSC